MPPIAKPQPRPATNVVRTAGRSRRRQRNIGSANMSASVPALPAHTHVDAARAGQRRARPSPTAISDLADQHDPDDDVDGDRQVLRRAARSRRRRSRTRSAIGIEDLAELAALVEVPGDVAVDPVGRAEHREQRRGRDAPRPASQSSQRNTGTHSSRTTEIRFGIVRCDSRFAGHAARVRRRC